MAIKIRIVSDFDKRGITAANQALNNLAKGAGIALAAVAAATAGIAIKSVQEFAKFDAALVKSTAIMGDLSDVMKNEMSQAARDVAKVTTFSAEQAAESFFFLASAGLDANSSIKALPQVAQFAQAGMFDMARATDLLTDAQSALGLTIRDDAVKNMQNMIKVSDVLVRANTLANASVEQFSVALTTKAGAALRALGKDVEEGVAVLAAFADQGIKGEAAGTQLAIVLRDLTTRAIHNKGAFDKMNIGVFDSNGNMNNLADIVGDLEVALEGMSDETQKATLLQLGFSDRSLGSLQALMGTSEAIKTYEKELRSSMGFTEDVANKQLDSFEAQLKLLESAFLDVAIQIGQELTPFLKDLIPVLQRLLPEIGKKLADAIRQVPIEKLITDFVNLFVAIVTNLDTIADVAFNIGLFAVALVTYTTAVKIATTATAIFNGTLLLNPFILLATGIAVATIALQKFTGENKAAREAATGLTGRQAEINAEFDRLRELLDANIISFSQYRDQVNPLVVELSALEGQLGATAGEFNRFNNLRISPKIDPRFKEALNQIVPLTNIELGLGSNRTARPVEPVIGGGGGGRSGPNAFEQARKRVQDLIKGSQKQLADAQKSFNNSIESANKNYADSVLRLQGEFATRLEGIIQTSQNRLRDAFRSAVQTNIAGLFDQQEEKSVAGLVKSLSDKLTASRNLLSNAARLASEGFSQTFIEQVISAGTETGNELASAILQSTPETQAELRSLFTALEIESSQGMDSLAEQIHMRQGLATRELNNLYRQTQTELAQAMIDQQSILESSLSNANRTFVDSVKSIKSALAEQLDDMKGQFGGMEKTIDQFIKKLDELIAKNREAAKMPVSAGTPSIGFLPEPVGATGIIAAFQPMPSTSPTRAPLQTAPIFNINVKTDVTQSNAMVGKSIVKEVNKFTGGGGSIRTIGVSL